jgi:hypothetical protein
MLTKLGLYDLRQHKPWFDEECSRFLDQRQQDTMQWLQHTNHNNADNLNKVRREDSRHFRKEKKEYLRAKIDELENKSKIKISEAYIGVSMTIKRGTSLDLTYKRMRSVIWLQTPTVFWLGRENISLSYGVYMESIMSGRQKYTQQSH